MTKWFFRFLYILSFLFIGGIVYTALPYYATPYTQRPFHPLHTVFKPAGWVGHGLGIVGSLMMIFMLGYSLRKRVRLFHRWGTLSSWLNVHIYFGIIGPLLVVLHSSFKLNGIISVSFWSMLIVMFSGIVGRYLYLKIPRDFSGEELTLKSVQEQAERLVHQLNEQYNIPREKVRSFLDSFPIQQMEQKPVVLLGFYLLFFDMQKARIFRKIRLWLQHEGVPKTKQKLLAQLVWQRLQIEFKLVLWNKIHLLFHYWHVFHKPFAIIMYLIMLVHVGIAVWLGYTWIF